MAACQRKIYLIALFRPYATAFATLFFSFRKNAQEKNSAFAPPEAQRLVFPNPDKPEKHCTVSSPLTGGGNSAGLFAILRRPSAISGLTQINRKSANSVV